MHTDRTNSIALLARSRGLLRGVALACLCATAMTAAARAEDDPAAAQRKQQLAALTQNFMENLRPVLRLELDYAKAFCGDLPADARRRIAAAGRDAMQQTAEQLALMHVPHNPAGIRRPVGDAGDRAARPRAAEPIDAHRTIHDAVAAAVQAHAAPEARAAYEREQALRDQRRRRRDCLRVMAIIAPHLALTAEQRSAISAALEEAWDPSWTAKLFQYSNVMPGPQGRPQSPRFAGEAIASHLDSAQRAVWEEWTKTTETHFFGGVWTGIHLGPAVTRLQADDPWWNP